MIQKGKIWAVVLYVTLFLVNLGLSVAESAEPKGVFKVSIHYTVSADWFDPSTAGDTPSMPIMYLFHDALVKSIPGNWYGPSIAESWKISPDYRVYEFNLRKGVKFHNGDPVTAEDVVFTFKRYKARNAEMFHRKFDKLEAVNPHLFRVTFKEPFVDFLDYMLRGASTLGWIVPKAYIEKVGDDGYKRNPVGCGPYRFVEFKPDVRFIGEAFKDYWRKVPNVKRIEYYMVKEETTRYAMVKKGEVDLSLQLAGVIYEQMKKDPGLRVIPSASPNLLTLTMHSQFDPHSPWSDARVRKAASLALDRVTIRDIDRPGSVIGGSLALEGDPNGVSFPSDSYDPERAKKLLAEAGYPNGFQGGKFYPHGSGFLQYGDLITNYLKAIGITLETVPIERASFLAMRKGGKLKGAIVLDALAQTTIDGRLRYLFDGIAPYGKYPDIEALWDQYNRSFDPKARKDLVGRIQKIIYDKTVSIPVTRADIQSAAGPRLKGDPFKVHPLAWWPAPVEDIELNE